MLKTSELVFPQRPRIGNEGRHWISKCWRYKVSIYRRVDSAPVAYYATVRLPSGVWDLISRHRIRSAAMEACQRHARRAA